MAWALLVLCTNSTRDLLYSHLGLSQKGTQDPACLDSCSIPTCFLLLWYSCSSLEQCLSAPFPLLVLPVPNISPTQSNLSSLCKVQIRHLCPWEGFSTISMFTLHVHITSEFPLSEALFFFFYSFYFCSAFITLVSVILIGPSCLIVQFFYLAL